MTSFRTREELEALGFRSIGENVLISRNATIYGAANMSIGSNVRIDDFCILSGKIEIGNYIHIAAYSAIYGGSAGVQIADFANISSRVCIYALSDDFSGETMSNPMIPDKYKISCSSLLLLAAMPLSAPEAPCSPVLCWKKVR